MMFPGYWVSFWVVALRIVDEEELSGLICIRYSVSDVTTLFTVLRTSYSRYAVLSVFTMVGKRRRPLRSAAAIVLALIALAGCGSSSTSHSSGSKGTPAGTYTATITATSGSLSHQTTLTVIVQ